MEQATTRDFDGRRIYRWYVWLPDGRRVISWAVTEIQAQAKCRERRGVEPVHIEPAPDVLRRLGMHD